MHRFKSSHDSVQVNPGQVKPTSFSPPTVVLNVCYRPANAVHTVSAVPTLISLLDGEDDHVQVAAAGALQSVVWRHF